MAVPSPATKLETTNTIAKIMIRRSDELKTCSSRPSSGSAQTSVRLCQVLDYLHEECLTHASFQPMSSCV
ncbi:hypothetical protein N7527_007588 [Penicillium freii]|nr:hypothetical protein N7527_007588 [Penicillium freii]